MCCGSTSPAGAPGGPPRPPGRAASSEKCKTPYVCVFSTGKNHFLPQKALDCIKKEYQKLFGAFGADMLPQPCFSPTRRNLCALFCSVAASRDTNQHRCYAFALFLFFSGFVAKPQQRNNSYRERCLARTPPCVLLRDKACFCGTKPYPLGQDRGDDTTGKRRTLPAYYSLLKWLPWYLPLSQLHQWEMEPTIKPCANLCFAITPWGLKVASYGGIYTYIYILSPARAN